MKVLKKIDFIPQQIQRNIDNQFNKTNIKINTNPDNQRPNFLESSIKIRRNFQKISDEKDLAQSFENANFISYR